MPKKEEPGKRRTRAHVIADLAFNHLERHVLRCGYTMHRVVQDYGLDATIRTFAKDGIIESGAIWVQLKASDAVRRLRKAPALGVRVQRRDLLSWIGELHPVILMLYDGKRDCAHWMHVQGELAGGRVFALAHEGATVTLHLNPDQRVADESVLLWRRVKNRFQASW